MIVTHLGSGIVKFDNVFSVDPVNFENFKLNLEKTIQRQAEEKSEGSVLTEGGYEISNEKMRLSPKRYTDLSTLTGQDSKFIKTLKSAMHNCVIEYCKVFPVVIENIRWVTNGYIIKYENGQFIGPHSDCNIAYESDRTTIVNSIPLYNVLTVGAFLNEDFTGGEISYRPWGITARPNTGSILIYPSSYIGCHEVAPVVDGERYAYLRWYGHGETPHHQNESIVHLLSNVQNSDQRPVLVGVLYDTEFD